MVRAKLPSEQRISKSRTRLLIGNPWFGTLALRMRIVSDPSVGTFANNGTTLYYNEDFLETLTDPQLLGVMAHEVMHCALGHMFRAGTRDFRKWNEAADIVINQILLDCNFELPITGFEDEYPIYRGMSSEQVYALRDKKEDGQNHDGCICGMQPAPKGDKDKQGNSTAGQMSQTDWQILAEQAAIVAKRAGKLPADLDYLITASHQSKTDWRTILRRFIEQTIPSDYSWMKPNRRFVSQGLYLPGMTKENTPRIGVAVDTSGSIGQKLLDHFASELTSIVREVRPERVDVIYCDAEVKGRESFTPDDPEIILHAKGGGGTAFAPALDAFGEDPPACVIYLTDGYGPWPTEPDFPVLWAIIEESSVTEDQIPWGGFVKLSEHD